MDFPGHLKSWRWARGWSQATLAARAGIFRPNLVDLESGKRDCTLKTLERLSLALGISPGRLLDSLPEEPNRLNRHEVDALAKGILKPESPLSSRLESLRKLFSPVLYPILRALGVEGWEQFKKTRVKNIMPLLRNKIHPQSLEQVIRRVSKLASSRL